MISEVLRWPIRTWLILVAAGSFGLVAAGLVLGVWLDLHPCPLCIFQRILYMVVGALALLAAFLPAPGRLLASGLAFLTAVGGVATAAYQTWLQAFPSPELECSFSDPNLIEQLVGWLGQLWPFMFLATGLCSSAEWVFLGLSMANWSVICFAVLAGLVFWLMRRRVA
jgi:disulfide bond formation protein DsbB